MGMYINSATGSLRLTRSLYQTSVLQSTTMKRLSSGIRINSASDDAAGLSLSEKLKSSINGNTVAKNNAQTGIALLNTADSALSNMTNSLERIRNLAVQAANGVYTSEERQMLQKEADALGSEVKQTYQSTKFSDKKVFGDEVISIDRTAAIAAGYTDAYIINTAAEFVSKIKADRGGSFILAKDIDMSELGVLDKAAIDVSFWGSLDGNGYSVKNLTIDTQGAAVHYIGLFSAITAGSGIKNLSIENASIKALASNQVGVLAGDFSSSVDGTSISNSSIEVGNGCLRIGGLAGRGGQTTNSQVTNTTIKVGNNCNSIGGLIGEQRAAGAISRSFAETNITGGNTAQYVGGLVGNINAAVSESYSAGNIVLGSTASSVGGLGSSPDAGCNLSDNYSLTNISVGINSNAIAGFVSGTSPGMTVKSSFATGNITAGSGSMNLAGFAVSSAAGIVDNTNFYKNNMSVDGTASAAANLNASGARPQDSWDMGKWGLSGTLPELKNCGKNPVYTEIQVGADAAHTSRVGLSSKFALGSVNFNISTQNGALLSISQIDAKMAELNNYRSEVGASVNKLSSVISIQDNRINNLGESRSNIQDADVASESAQMIKNQIRQQSGVALLSQMNGLDKNLLMQLIG